MQWFTQPGGSHPLPVGAEQAGSPTGKHPRIVSLARWPRLEIAGVGLLLALTRGTLTTSMTKINELLSRVVRLTRAATPTGCWPARTADNDRNERRLIKGDVERPCP